jgi:hypothetical protein
MMGRAPPRAPAEPEADHSHRLCGDITVTADLAAAEEMVRRESTRRGNIPVILFGGLLIIIDGYLFSNLCGLVIILLFLFVFLSGCLSLFYRQ